jgi:hypothetical protein
VLLPVTAYRGAVTAESLLATMQFVRDSGGTADSIYAGTFLTGGWWKNGDTAKVDTSFLWPHTALADSTVNLPDSAFGTAADFLRHYGQLRCGTTPIVTGTGAMVGGGASDTASGAYSVVAGGLANKASGDSSAVGGGTRNKATGRGGFVGGGEANKASGVGSVASGGQSNTASGIFSSVSGGGSNSATNTGSAIAGGQLNVANGEGGFVGGGGNNTASAFDATTCGGSNNTASGQYSFVGGGANNLSKGMYSFTLGGIGNLDSAYGGGALGCSLRVRAADSFAVNIGAGAGVGYLVSKGKRWIGIGVRQWNQEWYEDDSTVINPYVKLISHGHAQFDSTVAICTTASRANVELFTKGDIAASGNVYVDGTDTANVQKGVTGVFSTSVAINKATVTSGTVLDAGGAGKLGSLILGDTWMTRAGGGAAFNASTSFSVYDDSISGVDTIQLSAMNRQGAFVAVYNRGGAAGDSVFVKNGSTTLATLTAGQNYKGIYSNSAWRTW